MSWGEALIAILIACQDVKLGTDRALCQSGKLACFHKAVDVNPKEANSADMLNQCLVNSKVYDAVPKASPSPSVTSPAKQ